MNKNNKVKTAVGGKFFTVERKNKNKMSKHCAVLVSETDQYLTIRDVNTEQQIKMNKSSIVSIKCGKAVMV